MGNPLRTLARAHRSVDKHALVMRNANSNVDIYPETANNIRYLSNSRANGAAPMFAHVRFTRTLL